MMVVDLLADFPGWCTKFEPMRRQEQSRTASGAIYVKDLGSPLWSATYATVELTSNVLDRWRSRLEAIEDRMQQFWGRSLSRCRPIAYPGTAAVPASGVSLSNIGEDNASASLAGLSDGFRLSEGDLLQIAGSGLYRVTADATANIYGVAGPFGVVPHFWPGTSTGTAVTLLNPSCAMIIVPGSVSSEADKQTGRGVITFQAIEYR